MKTILLALFSAALLALPFTGCTTAHEAAHDSADLATHAVEKTGHAVAHGERKLAKHL